MLIRAQYHLDTLHYAGDSKVFIDIVYLGDGFTEDEMDKFADFVKEIVSEYKGYISSHGIHLTYDSSIDSLEMDSTDLKYVEY